MVVHAEMTTISLSLTRSLETRVIQGTKGSDDKIYVKYIHTSMVGLYIGSLLFCALYYKIRMVFGYVISLSLIHI